MSEFLVRPLIAWYDWALFLFLFADIGMMALVIYDSRSRQQSAIGWIVAIMLPILALLPALVVTLQYADLDPLILSPTLEPVLAQQLVTFFVIGLVAGVVPIAVGILYLLRTVRQSATFEIEETMLPFQSAISQPVHDGRARPNINAWLVDSSTGQSYQLFEHDTRIGRDPGKNQIVLNDGTISREHVLIRQEGHRLTLFDRGSRTGTFVNDQQVRSAVLLAHGDEIIMGDVVLEFVSQEK